MKKNLFENHEVEEIAGETENYQHAPGTIGRTIEVEVARQLNNYEALLRSMSSEEARISIEVAIWNQVFIAEEVKKEIDSFFAELRADEGAPAPSDDRPLWERMKEDGALGWDMERAKYLDRAEKESRDE